MSETNSDAVTLRAWINCNSTPLVTKECRIGGCRVTGTCFAFIGCLDPHHQKGQIMWRLSEDTIATDWPNNQFAVAAKQFADAANQAWKDRNDASQLALDLAMDKLIGLATPLGAEAGALRLARELLNAAAHRMIQSRVEPPAPEFSGEWFERLRDEFRECAQLFLMVAEAAWHSLSAPD